MIIQKKIIRFFTALLLTTAIFCTPGFAYGSHEATNRSDLISGNLVGADFGISVTGTGTISLKPDTATILLAVVTRDIEAAKAAQLNADLMTKVMTAVQAKGIADDGLATKNFSMFQESNYDSDGNRKTTGYKVTNNLTVTINDIEKVGEVIDAALSAGANQLSSINFFARDTTEAYTQARKLAVQQATDAATTLAQAAGCTLGSAFSITEQSNNSGYRNEVAYDAVMLQSKSAVMGTPVTAGSTDITVNVNMRFTIK